MQNGRMWDLRCEIFPADLDAAAEFYTDVLGFELERDERGTADPYLAFRRGRVRLGAARRSDPVPRAWRRPPVGIELVLEVDDLEAARDRVRSRGWPLEEDLVERPWGLRDFRLLDPDGYYWRVTDRPE